MSQKAKTEPDDDGGFDVLVGGGIAGLFAGTFGTLLVAGIIAFTVKDPSPFEGQLGEHEYEATGAILQSTDPELLAAGLKVRVDPSGDRCRFSIELEGGPTVTGETSCETDMIDDCAHLGGGCAEKGVKLEGLTSDGFAKIDELTGTLELEWGGEGSRRRIEGVLVRTRREP